MAVARLRRLTLSAHQREPVGVLLEIGFRVQAVPGVTDRDRDRPARAVVPFPLGQVAGADRRATEAVPDLSLQSETRKLPFVPTAGDGFLLGHDLPRLAGEVPAAAERVQQRRHRLPDAGYLTPDHKQVLPIALDEEAFTAELLDAVELPPGEVRCEPDVNAGQPFASRFYFDVRTADCAEILPQFIDRLLDAAGENRQHRDAVLG